MREHPRRRAYPKRTPLCDHHAVEGIHARSPPATPWGFLPPRMRVLYITTAAAPAPGWPRRLPTIPPAKSSWKKRSARPARGSARLRDQVFEAVLVSHEPHELDALDLLDGLLRGGPKSR